MLIRRGLLVLALLWTIGFGLWLLFGPIDTSSSSESVVTSEGVRVTPPAEVPRRGLRLNEGVPLLIVAIPLLLAGAPLVVPRNWQRGAAAVSALLVLAGSIFGAMSVGLFYMPAALILGIAAAWPARISKGVITPLH